MRFRKTKGFTLVEVVVSIAIIAILSSLGVVCYTQILENSIVKSDMTVAESLSLSLQEKNIVIEDENDLRREIDNLYNEGYFDSITPESSKYGYHYWYNYNTHEVVLKKSKELASDAKRKEFKAGQTKDYKYFENTNRSNLVSGYYLLDRSGSVVVDVNDAIDNIHDEESYEYAINRVLGLNDDKNEITVTEELYKWLKTTTIINDHGSFRFSEVTNVNAVSIKNKTSVIPGDLYIYDEESRTIIKTSSSTTYPIAEVESIYIPTSVEEVQDGALFFKEEYTVTVYFDDDVSLNNVFKNHSTNGILNTGDHQYEQRGNLIIDVTPEEEIVVANKIVSFDVTSEEEIVSSSMYVPFTQGSIQFEADNLMYSEEGGTDTAIAWSIVSGKNNATIDENGLLEFKPNAAGVVIVRARSKYNSSCYKEITVHIVRVLGFDVTIGGSAVHDGSYSSFIGSTDYPLDIKYTITTNYPNVKLGFDFPVTFETDNLDIAHINDGEQTVLQFNRYGLSTITAKVDGFAEFDISTRVELIDSSAVYFIRNFAYEAGKPKQLVSGTDYSYNELYREFNIIPTLYQNYKISVDFYDLLESDGNGGYEEVSGTYGFNVNTHPVAINTLSNRVNYLKNSKFRFSGTGVCRVAINVSTESDELINSVQDVVLEIVDKEGVDPLTFNINNSNKKTKYTDETNKYREYTVLSNNNTHVEAHVISGHTYTYNFNNATVTKYGRNIPYSVELSNGTALTGTTYSNNGDFTIRYRAYDPYKFDYTGTKYSYYASQDVFIDIVNYTCPKPVISVAAQDGESFMGVEDCGSFWAAGSANPAGVVLGRVTVVYYNYNGVKTTTKYTGKEGLPSNFKILKTYYTSTTTKEYNCNFHTATSKGYFYVVGEQEFAYAANSIGLLNTSFRVEITFTDPNGLVSSVASIKWTDYRGNIGKWKIN